MSKGPAYERKAEARRESPRRLWTCASNRAIDSCQRVYSPADPRGQGQKAIGSEVQTQDDNEQKQGMLNKGIVAEGLNVV